MTTFIKTILFFAMTIGTYGKGIELPNTLKADFTNIITNTKKKKITYSGNMKFSNKSLLKWVYTKPTKKEVCTNNHELIVVDHDLEQVSTYVIAKGFDLLKILKSAKLHSKNIYTSKYDGQTVTIQVDNKQKLHSIAYFDDLDNKVQIVFKNVKYGKGHFSKKSMACKIPKDYDMIRG